MSQDGTLSVVLLPLLLLLFVGFMFWSQRKRARAIQDIQAGLTVGDEVCTTSGLFGRITDLDDLVVTLEIAAGTRVRFDRRAVATKVDRSASGPTLSGPGSAPSDSA